MNNEYEELEYISEHITQLRQTADLVNLSKFSFSVKQQKKFEAILDMISEKLKDLYQSRQEILYNTNISFYFSMEV